MAYSLFVNTFIAYEVTVCDTSVRVSLSDNLCSSFGDPEALSEAALGHLIGGYNTQSAVQLLSATQLQIGAGKAKGRKSFHSPSLRRR